MPRYNEGLDSKDTEKRRSNAGHSSREREKRKTHAGHTSKEREKETPAPGLLFHERKKERSSVGVDSNTAAVRGRSHSGHASDTRKENQSDVFGNLETRAFRKANHDLEAEIEELELENQHLMTLNRNINLQLQGKIEELEQYKHLRTDNESLSSAIQRLKKANQDLEKKVEEFQQYSEHLLTDNESLTVANKGLKKANIDLEERIGELELHNEQLKKTNESVSSANKGLRKANEDLASQIEALKAQSERKHKGLAADNQELRAEAQELRVANEDLKQKLETVKAKADRQKQELLKVNERLLVENEDLKNAIQDYKSLDSAMENLRAEISLVKTTSKQDYEELKREYEGLVQENQSLQKENQRLKDQEKAFQLDSFVAGKLQKENENLKKDHMNEELMISLEKLKRENIEIKHELENLTVEATYKAQEEPYAVPLNENWNSLSLGREMYDSLFSVKVDTPNIWPDPLVWNIFYAAVPPEYTIPDPDFTNDITRNVAWGLLKPTLESRSLSYEQFINTFADQTYSKDSGNELKPE